MTGYLRLRDVVKSYDGKTNAVDGVSIDFERGEFVTLDQWRHEMCLDTH